jgi:ASPIC and UnbV/FG-GAP-like repeat
MNESSVLRSRRLAVVILGGLTAIVLVALVVLAATHGKIAASSTRKAGPADSPHGAAAHGGGYQPRVPVETSGFFELLGRLPRWAPEATLEQIAAVWRDTPRQAIAAIEEELKSTDLPDTKKVERAFSKAVLYVAEGDIDRAAKVLEEARSWVEKDDAMSKAILYTIIFNQGVLALRRGETDNCVMCRGESSCILPIAPAAIHTNPAGSRLAIKHFSDYLAQFPDDLGVRWILNLAHMTLGEHPDKVDPRYLIRLDHYLDSEFNIGKFRDIGHAVGVDRFSSAGGAVMEDFDNDGRLDLAVTSSDPTQHMGFFHNAGDGAFADRAQEAGLMEQLGGKNLVQTDYNNDGRMDLFISRGAWFPHPMPQSLLRNDGNGKFSDVTKQAGLKLIANSTASRWADYDNDGWLDVFILCEEQTNHLYHNRADGTFEDVTTRAGVEQDYRQFCKGADWIDYDNDDYPDLFVDNMNGDARLYHNNRNGTFTDVTSSLGIDGPHVGFSCWAWDYDNDGWLDIFATCYDRALDNLVKSVVGQPHSGYSNRLFHNVHGERFENRTKEAGLDQAFATMGCNFGDFDNDGFLDFYLGTGDTDLFTLVPNRMFKNVAGRRFADITASSGTGNLQKGHGVSCADWDRDGDVDVYIEMGGATAADKYHSALFQNPGQGNHWLNVKLVGKKTNRAAIGARLKVVTAGDAPLTVHRHISAGSSWGANPLEQHVGLGGARQVARLEVHWPTSGTTQIFRDLAADQAIEITELAEGYRQREWKPIHAPTGQ